MRGKPVIRRGLAKWSIGCLDLATAPLCGVLLLNSQLLSLGLIASTHPHQLVILVVNVERIVLAAACKSGFVVRRESAQSRVGKSTLVQPR